MQWTVFGTIRNGAIILDHPIDLPDGTRVMVTIQPRDETIRPTGNEIDKGSESSVPMLDLARPLGEYGGNRKSDS